MTEQRSTQGRLARTDASGNGDKALSFVNPVKEVVEGLLVMATQKQISLIWRQIEGVFLETEVSAVH
jgi:hypothetical protein